MRHARRFTQLLGMLAIVCTLGCASAYHDYECSVNCQYCVPRPLPYADYNPSVCHSLAAAPYLTGTVDATLAEAGVPTPADAIEPAIEGEQPSE